MQFGDLTVEALSDMHRLEKKLEFSPIHGIPNARGKYTLDTDVWNVQVGYVLLQKQLDGTTELIGNRPRLMTEAE